MTIQGYHCGVELNKGLKKNLKNATGKNTSIKENHARIRANHHNTRNIYYHNLQLTADL
jgi:hypothetical protein